MLARRFRCSCHSHFRFLNIRSRELNCQTCTRLLPDWALREVGQMWGLILFYCTVHPWLKTACSLGRFSSSAAVGPGCFVTSLLALQQAALGFSLWPDFSQTNVTASFSWWYDLLSGCARANLNTLFVSVVQFPLVFYLQCGVIACGEGNGSRIGQNQCPIPQRKTLPVRALCAST